MYTSFTQLLPRPFEVVLLVKELPPSVEIESPPFVAIYYKRENSNWFTESLYRKRVRFSFKDGILKLDRTNFWDWFELAEIKVLILL